MAATGSHVQPSKPATDVGVIWHAAIERYEKITQVKAMPSVGSNNVEQILTQIEGMKIKFEKKRHDGSKMDKFRTLVKNTVIPIQQLSDIVVQATKIV